MTNDMEIISKKEAKEKGLKRYFTGKSCEYGHIAERQLSSGDCLECKAEYRKKNKDKKAERQREYYKQNKDKISKREKERYNKNKDKIAERRKDHYNKNKGKIADRRKEYSKEYYKKNPASAFIRGSLKRIFTNWKGGRKKMEKLHGYTYEQLVTRIEFQFKDGMSWDNRSEWHIDHKKPITRFLGQGITDPKIINALSNLQPMWASENLSKGAKFEL
ncbi:hypothetical protein NVP1173O_52 [Vibrio phage 1.173.O._10N.261.55.A11]|nr:hypothetical protein NVP1173O_52 [Vibrio phage 1.173.O._10N.261.55.A11]